MTLTEFLTARLDEDEANVLDGWDSDAKARVASVWTGGEPGYSTVATARPGEPWIADGREVGDARHVRVLLDPARVLAEVEATRQVIALAEDAFAHSSEDLPKAYMRATLKWCALPYADHPDYDEAWRP